MAGHSQQACKSYHVYFVVMPGLQILHQFRCHAPVSSFGMGSLSWPMAATAMYMADAHLSVLCVVRSGQLVVGL